MTGKRGRTPAELFGAIVIAGAALGGCRRTDEPPVILPENTTIEDASEDASVVTSEIPETHTAALDASVSVTTTDTSKHGAHPRSDACPPDSELAFPPCFLIL